MSQNAAKRRDLGDGTGRTALVDGSVVGGYTVSYLASGGMSVVYKGEKDGQTAVLKEVLTTNSREVPSLISEKTLLERLKHPALISYHTFFTEDGYYYLVVDYVPGAPLSKFLKDGTPPPVNDVVDWALQLCDVFGYLHQQSPPVIYRDLKSENILLEDGQIKLIDFGIARVHKGTRQSDTELMGSPVTASPEHYGGAETDARSDIYTLGATIYELLTGGRRLQVGAFAFAPVRQLRPDVPEELDKVILKALEFKPADRFQTAEEFRDAILKAVGRAVPALPPDPEGVPKTKRKLGFAMAALTLLLVGGALVASRLMGVTNKSLQNSLEGNLFAAGTVDGQQVVFLGEDVGLFQVTAWQKEVPAERAKTLAKRLNTFYHSPCPACNTTALEPADIKVGRYVDTGEVVVFYAHMHGFDKVHWGPELLATVDEAQAKNSKVAPRFLAAYWRDLLRDTVSLSRGFPVSNSALGAQLADALGQAREDLSGEEATVENLRSILRKTTASEASSLRTLFEKVPERQPEADQFGGVKGYEPLRI